MIYLDREQHQFVAGPKIVGYLASIRRSSTRLALFDNRIVISGRRGSLIPDNVPQGQVPRCTSGFEPHIIYTKPSGSHNTPEIPTYSWADG
jgi:hypothetical protein